MIRTSHCCIIRTKVLILCIAAVTILIASCPMPPPPSPSLLQGDLNDLADALILDPKGIWSDGTTMWIANNVTDIVDFRSDEPFLFAYNMRNKLRDGSREFPTLLVAGNGNPTGLWSDGTTMWVLDSIEKRIYAYNVESRIRDTSKEFVLSPTPERRLLDIWSDGSTMWVLENTVNIFAYDMESKMRLTGDARAAKDIPLASLGRAEQFSPTGIWSDGTTMWVSNNVSGSGAGDKIFAYNMSTKAHDAGKDFNTLDPMNKNPLGIWSDGNTMWVLEGTAVDSRSRAKLYAYNLSNKSRDP